MKKTADEIANEAIMTRRNSSALVLLLEGLSDEKLFRKFLADPDTEVICSWGKEAALDAVVILDSQGFVGFLAILDADFWHLDGYHPLSPSVLLTDEHDVEMMMIRSGSFPHFITEVASDDKMRRFLLNHGVSDIRDILLQLSLPIGCLRRHSQRNDLGLCFNTLKFSTFVDVVSLTIDYMKIAATILTETRNASLDCEAIVRQMLEMAATNRDDPYQVCCGHDVVSILGIALRRCIGSRSNDACSKIVLESILRLSYDSSCFRQTQLFVASQEWSRNNRPYIVFA